MTSSEELLAFVREYRDAFSSFDPARFEPYLTEEPTYHAGMAMRRGRAC